MVDPVSELGEPFVALGCKYVRLERATSVVDRLVGELAVAKATVEGCASPVVREVVAEVERAKSLHPRWPDDNPFEGLAVLTEEVGELAQALLDRKNGRFPSVREEVEAKAAVLAEAVQVAAMGLRLLESLSREGVSDV